MILKRGQGFFDKSYLDARNAQIICVEFVKQHFNIETDRINIEYSLTPQEGYEEIQVDRRFGTSIDRYFVPRTRDIGAFHVETARLLNEILGDKTAIYIKIEGVL